MFIEAKNNILTKPFVLSCILVPGLLRMSLWSCVKCSSPKQRWLLKFKCLSKTSWHTKTLVKVYLRCQMSQGSCKLKYRKLPKTKFSFCFLFGSVNIKFPISKNTGICRFPFGAQMSCHCIIYAARSHIFMLHFGICAAWSCLFKIFKLGEHMLYLLNDSIYTCMI